MSGAGAAVGLILGGWLTGLDLRSSARHRRLAADLPDQHPDRHRRRARSRRASSRESESHPRRARPPRRRHRHARPARHRLRPHPRRHRLRLERHLDASPAWSPASSLLALFVLIESRVEHPLLPFRVFAEPHPGRELRGDVASLPAAMFAMFFFLSLYIQNVMGYSPLQGRLRVPAVLRRHRGRGAASPPTWSTGSTRATSPASAR